MAGGEVYTVAVSPLDANIVVSGDAEGNLTLWDVEARSMKWSAPVAAEDEMFGVSFAPDGTRIACASHLGRVILVDASTGVLTHELRASGTVDHKETLKTVQTQAGGSVGDVAFSPDGTTLVSSDGSKACTLLVWDLESMALKAELVDEPDNKVCQGGGAEPRNTQRSRWREGGSNPDPII